MRLTVDRDGDLAADLTSLDRAMRTALDALRVDITQAADRTADQSRARFAGRRLGISVRSRAAADALTVTIAPNPAGPWVILEHGTRAHQIRARRARVLASAGDVYGERVAHPGSRGAGRWTSTTARLDDEIDRIVAARFDRALS